VSATKTTKSKRKADAALACWLIQAEKAFALIAEIFDGIGGSDVATPERAAQCARIGRDMESQARQIRTALMMEGTSTTVQ
jgi:hypothetical protein